MRHKTTQFIRFLLMFLFLYTGYIKIIEFDTFGITLLKSNLINDSFVPFLQYFLPTFEILIVISLFTDKLYKTGLYISFFTLVLFTFYLIALNNFSLYQGCSCGGIFDELTYSNHVIVNLFFVLLNFFGIILLRQNE